MGIPESQLERWSHQGAVATAKVTHESIRNALTYNSSPIRDKDFEVYLQGSYKNSTNIRGDSDVDIIVQLNSTFRYDVSSLSEHEKILFERAYSNAEYLWREFRTDVLRTLQDHYDITTISEGNKSLRVSGDSGRLPADIVVCLKYRTYKSFENINDQRYIEGIVFYALRENRWIINFPKLHYDNGTCKNGQNRTNGLYKPSVRVFKNARTYLSDKNIITQTLAPSYFFECLLYNVPDEHFGSNFQNTFLNVLTWVANSFSNGQYQEFLCQNEQLPLFGNTPEQWSANSVLELLRKLIKLWEDW